MPTRHLLFIVLLLLSLSVKHVSSQTLDKNYLVREKLFTTENGLVSRDVYCAVQDDLGFIWFGTKYGLNRFDGLNCILFTTDNGLYSNTITNLVKGSSNEIFIEYGDQWQPFDIQNRIDVFDCGKLKVVATVTKENQGKFNSLPQEVILNLNEGRNWRVQSVSLSTLKAKLRVSDESARLYQSPNCSGRLLVTRDLGVYYLEGELEYEVLDSEEFFREGNTIVNYFFKDVQGNIWICVEKGVYRINVRDKLFRSMFTSGQLSEHKIPQVRGISVSDYNQAPAIQAVLLNALISKSDNLNFVRKNGLSWGLLEFGGGIYFSADGLFIEADPVSFRERRSCELKAGIDKMVNCIFPMNDSIFLLGRGGDILFLNRQSFKNDVVPKEIDSGIPDVKNVYRFFNSSRGLVAVAENGLFVLSDNIIVDYYGPEAKSPDRNLPISYLLDACEDQSNNLWLGTNGQGLVKWNWHSNGSPIEYYTTSHGVPSMIIYRLEKDELNNLWASTDDGVFSLNLNSNLVRVFKIEDGLPSNEFNRTSSFKTSSGDIYFGSVNGVVGFSPRDFNLTEHSESSPLRIVGISKRTKGNASEIDLIESFNQLGQIIWTNSDYLLEIDFALLDFRGYGISYSYRIPGVVDEWTILERNTLTLGSLPQGVFSIEVRAQLENGEVVEKNLIIPIEVIPPFYLRVPFVLMALAGVVLTVLLIVWARGRKLKKQNLKLEGLVLDRTNDLVKSLDEKDILLKELHHRVKNNLQTIISLLDLQKEQLKDSSAIEALSVSQTRLSSIALIHENFYNTNNLKDISFDSFIRDLTNAIQISFGKTANEVHFELGENDICIDIASAVPLGLAVNELLTNSLKHIDATCYPVVITIELLEVSSYEYELTYRDNGQGFPADDIMQKPNSLGLKLVKGLTLQLKGNLKYSNNNGSIFVILFPKNRNSQK